MTPSALRAFIVVLILAATSIGATAATAAPGDLDPSFDGDGKLVGNVGGIQLAITDVAIQPDGKIVLVGTASDDFAVVRLNPDGSPDMGFGTGGATVVDAVSGSQDIANAVALQPDGKIVVAGGSTVPNSITFATFLRLNSNGTPDASFDPAGTTGPVHESVGIARGDTGQAYDLAFDSAGRIVYAGTDTFAEPTSFVGRLNGDGTQDGTWGTGANDIFAFSGPESVARLALQPDGKVVVVGSVGQGTGSDVAVVRVLAGGSGLDPGFGNGGRLIFGYGANAEDAATDVAVQPDGKIDVGGYGGSGDDFTLTRLTSGGVIDASFGGGSVFADFGGTNLANAMGLQANGKVVLAGSASGTAFGVARFHPGGALDTTFGTGGKVTVDFPAASDAWAMAIQADGKIVVAGNNALGQTVMVRLQGDSPASGGAPGGGGGGSIPAAVRCGGKQATIVGTDGNDKLKGTRKADVIVGLGGNDRISGLAGNDVICGGSGNDKLVGGNGNDKLYGDAGKDSLAGDAGKDVLSGGAGKDSLSGGSGKDKLNGGSGTDKLNGGSGKDSCAGKDPEKSC